MVQGGRYLGFSVFFVPNGDVSFPGGPCCDGKSNMSLTF